MHVCCCNRCSTDINIFAHPHYDTYHDLALVHWHAFRIPDNAILSFQCDCVVCSDIVDDDGQNGCDLIPTVKLTSTVYHQFISNNKCDLFAATRLSRSCNIGCTAKCSLV